MSNKNLLYCYLLETKILICIDQLLTSYYVILYDDYDISMFKNKNKILIFFENIIPCYFHEYPRLLG